MKALFIGDDLEVLNLQGDTSLCLAEGCLGLGYEVFWSLPQDIILFNNMLMVEQAKKITHISRSGLSLESYPELTSVNDFECVFLRKDPPFDGSYLTLCWLLQVAQVPCFNTPDVVAAFHEKILHITLVNRGFLNTSDIIPTYFGKSMKVLSTFLKDHDGQHGFVVKPWLGYGGRGIRHLVTQDQVFTRVKSSQHPPVSPGAMDIVQPFDPNIRVHGDRRVLYVFGTPVGDFVRLPQGDRIEANLAQGGSAHLIPRPPGCDTLIEKIGIGLKSLKIAFAGADVIGNKVNEINITSPTGLRTLEDLKKTPLGKTVVKMMLVSAGLMGCVTKKSENPIGFRTFVSPLQRCYENPEAHFKGYLRVQGVGTLPFELSWSKAFLSFDVLDPLGVPSQTFEWRGNSLEKRLAQAPSPFDSLDPQSIKKIVCGGVGAQSMLSHFTPSRSQGQDALHFKTKSYPYEFILKQKDSVLITSLSLKKMWWQLGRVPEKTFEIRGAIKGNMYEPISLKDTSHGQWALYFIHE